jgi:hypothetical protein
MKEKQVCFEITVADLNPIFLAHEKKIPSQFQDEFFHLDDQGFLQIGFVVIGGQLEEFEEVIRLEDA